MRDDKSPTIRIAELEEECRQLRIKLLAATRPKIQFPLRWGLSPNEGRVLAALYAGNGRLISLSQLFEAIYGWGETDITTKNVCVYIHRLRRKLPKRIQIVTRREAGWALDATALKIMREATQ